MALLRLSVFRHPIRGSLKIGKQTIFKDGNCIQNNLLFLAENGILKFRGLK